MPDSLGTSIFTSYEFVSMMRDGLLPVSYTAGYFRKFMENNENSE